MNNDMEKVYTTKETAQMVGIESVTVRKYAQQLEQEGYHIVRNKQGHRMFSEKDVLILNQFKAMRNGDTNKGTVSVELAAQILAEKHKNNEAIQNISSTDTRQNNDLRLYDERYNELIQKLSMIDDVLQENRELKVELRNIHTKLDEQNNKLDEQTRYIGEAMKQRDENLMAAIRDMQQQKQIASASEGEAEEQQGKRGFFARLFASK